MKRKHAGIQVLPKDWTEVIEKVQEVLTQTQLEAAAREQALPEKVPSAPGSETAAAWKQGFEQFDERLRLFQSRVQQAEDNAEDAELALADGEKALEYWLARANEINQRVAKTEATAASPDSATA